MTVSEILLACCLDGDNTINAHLRRPYRSGHHILATDGRIAARVPAETVLSLDIGESGPTPNPEWWDRSCYALEAIALQIDGPVERDSPCTHCGGTGVTKWGRGCWPCDETGRIAKMPNTILGKVRLANWYLDKLIRFGASLYLRTGGTIEQPHYWTCGEVEGLLMGMTI
jgi:hypothetical protein